MEMSLDAGNSFFSPWDVNVELGTESLGIFFHLSHSKLRDRWEVRLAVIWKAG